MNNALAFYPTQDEFGAMMSQADVLVKSGFLPQSIKTKEQAVTIMMVGRELNIPPWQALTGVNVIQGKPAVAPQLMLALIYRTGLSEGISFEEGKDFYSVTMKRKGEPAKTEKFTMDDANRMGLANKDNWRKQPMTMLKWRAVSACARVAYPDVIMGMYTPEELAPDNVSVNDQGDMTYTQPPVVLVERPTPTPENPRIVQLPSESATRIIKGAPKDEQPTTIIVDGTDGSSALVLEPASAIEEERTTTPTGSWDTDDVLNMLLRKCRAELGVYMPDIQASDIMRLIGLPDKDFSVLAYWTERYPHPRAAFDAIEDAVKFETLAQ